MGFQSNNEVILWRLHLHSSPHTVYQMLSTDQGRARFWAESAIEKDGFIDFVFPNGQKWRGKILERQPDRQFIIEYIGNSITTFELTGDGTGGTELRLIDRGVPLEEREEVIAGWVSVLMSLKGAVDYKVDLRNHNPERTWNNGYVEN